MFSSVNKFVHRFLGQQDNDSHSNTEANPTSTGHLHESDRVAVLQQLDAEFERVKRIMESDQWRVIEEPSESNQFVRISRMYEQDSNLAIFKGEGLVRDTPVENVWRTVYDINLRKQWDKMFLGGGTIDTLTEDGTADVIHMRFSPPLPIVSNRDFVIARCWREIPNSRGGSLRPLPPPPPSDAVIMEPTMRATLTPAIDACTSSIWMPNVSIEHPGMPPNREAGFVRGKIITAGGIIRPIFELDNSGNVREHTHVLYYIQVDPAGHIPHFVTNIAGKSQLAVLAKLKKCAERISRESISSSSSSSSTGEQRQQQQQQQQQLKLKYYDRQQAMKLFREQAHANSRRGEAAAAATTTA